MLMEGGGQFMFGDFPDDPGPAFGEEGEHDVPRGWLAPEDRLWRHPSEMSGASAVRRPPAMGGHVVSRWGALTVGVVGVVAVAGVAFSLTRNSVAPLSAHSAPFVTTDTNVALAPSPSSVTGTIASGPGVLQIVDALRPSLVSVVITQGGKTTRATGVVLPGGRLVVTAAAAVGVAKSVVIITSDGQQQSAQVAGTDPHAGVSVIRSREALSSAPWSNEAVQAHQIAVTECLCGGSSGGIGADAAVGMVRGYGTAALTDGGPSLVDAIEAEAALGPSPWGSVLLDNDGDVLGILDGSRTTGNETFGYFVPTSLVIGVARELAAGQTVNKGWLGVVCADAPEGGAALSTVMPGGPAATAGLRSGDIVEAVNRQPVESLSDLQADLYMSPPGTTLQLTVIRGGSTSVVPVLVEASPS